MALAVLVHGGGGGAWEWDFWRSELESRGYLFRPIDLEPSDGRYESTSLEDYVQQIVLFALNRSEGSHEQWLPTCRRPHWRKHGWYSGVESM